MSSYEDFSIEINGNSLQAGPLLEKESASVINEINQYLENIRMIESVGGFSFDHYERFSPDSLMVSKIVLSFLKKEAFVDKPRYGLKHLSVNIPKGDFENTKGFFVARIVTQMNGNVILNSKAFAIEEERALLKKCIIRAVDKSNSEYDTLIIDMVDNEVQYEYVRADEPDELFNTKE